MDTLRQDLVYALRRLRQAPGFTLIAVATLALGIGANSAIFSVVNAVLLKPLPFEEPDRLVRVSQTWKGNSAVYSPANFLDTAGAASSFESLAAHDGGGFTLTEGGAPARVDGATVSASFFEVLRARPVLGRGFLAEENEPGKHRVAVLGHALWRARFGGDPGIIGRTIQIDRESYEVVGVAPPGFAYPVGSELWTPLQYDEQFRIESRGSWYLGVVGRLRRDVTLEGARQELAAIAARLVQQYPDDNEGVGATVDSLHEATVRQARAGLLVLLGAVGFVLLIACVNVANLLLARVLRREAEIAVRAALGAGRARLLRQLLTEAVVLAVLGGGAGLALASVSLDALLALRPEAVPRLVEIGLDRNVLAFAATGSIATGLLFGILPALHLIRRPAASALREGGRGVLGGRGHRLRGALVVGQMAMALVLLSGAGLLLRSFAQLRRVDPGFRSEGTLAFRIALPESAYPDDEERIAFYDRLFSRIAALPGVRSVGGVTGLPLTGNNFTISFEVAGRPPVPPAEQPSMQTRIASPGYFETMGIPLRRGRRIEARDGATAAQVVVLSEAAVRQYFQDEDPLGRVLKIGLRRGPGKPGAGGEVVGIVGDVKEHGLQARQPPAVYIPYEQYPTPSLDVVVHTSLDPGSLAAPVEACVRELDPQLPLTRVATLDEVVARSLAEPRFYAILLGAFAATALFLAALGIFGALSYAVSQRSREIGIRVALGAQPAEVLGMVLRHALTLAALGMGIGLAGALALSRAISGMLFGLSPSDPATLGGVAALLAAVALLASYIPARRATRVDPVEALRAE
jgi:predicted permease